jgi:enoyl-CoA hydratase
MALFHVEAGAVTVVRFDRPPANAINRDFFLELEDLVRRLEAPEVRAAVLTGTGKFFSAGLDLFEVFNYDAAGGRDFARRFDRGLTSLFAFTKPLVAAVNGHAVAGGAVLADMADFRLMAAGTGKVGLTELPLGVPFPTVALEVVRYACAGPHLHEVLLRGRLYGPEDACARRLVDEVVPSAELLPRARALAEELARIHPPAFSETKRLLRADTTRRLQAVCEQGDSVWEIWRTPETRAAMEAYRTRTLHG